MSAVKRNSASTESMNGQEARSVEEITIPVPWGHVSGRLWGSIDQQPIVALHGWQDNCGTFDNLIPLLPNNVSVLCLDMPGHGLSSHYPKSQYYYLYWDGIILLRRIVKHFKWNKIKLLGHSLGGSIGFLYAASFPEDVDLLISIDIVGPTLRNALKHLSQTGHIVDKFLTYESHDNESVPTYCYDDVLDIVENAYGGSVTEDSAKVLMKRGVRPSCEPGRFYFTRDPRLKIAALGIPGQLDIVLEYASRIKCAYLNIRALSGLKYDDPDTYKMTLDRIKLGSKKFEYHEVEGTHHVHLNNPENVAPIISNFLSS
ncbi:putative serine hydrolase [Lasioglossum baleicum]|uniref:putative serine hydrolase n=1 Tax=Lasioglossum baleicum TaxID=434251 RepID=UPI003FCEBA53